MYPILFLIAKGLFFAMIVLLILDIITLYFIRKGVVAERLLPERFSNGDDNSVHITIHNYYKYKLRIDIIDEIPFQFQKRDFKISLQVKPHDFQKIEYRLRPTERGIYSFGKMNVYVTGILGFIYRRYIFAENSQVPTYPSFIHLRKYELQAFTNRLHLFGNKKLNRLGHSTEFDQIRNYVHDDDIRYLNWKATAKHGIFMVNQFQDERAQPVYSIIDKGRVMKMPFNALSLLDYAINATLVISDIALLKHDRAGMLSFSNQVDNMVAADKRNTQMQLIMEKLYHINTDYKETDFGKLYAFVKSKITHRSLLLIYTNFETLDALHRQLNYLKALSKYHLVVVIFFKNDELDNIIETKSRSVQEIYDKATAEKFNFEKRLIVAELRKYGIHSILTKPQDLSTETINKYLELKHRGLF